MSKRLRYQAKPFVWLVLVRSAISLLGKFSETKANRLPTPLEMHHRLGSPKKMNQ